MMIYIYKKIHIYSKKNIHIDINGLAAKLQQIEGMGVYIADDTNGNLTMTANVYKKSITPIHSEHRNSHAFEKREDMPATSAAPARSSSPSKKVIVEFPEALLERADAQATELDTNRSEFIRRAVKKFVSLLEKKKLEKELAEAYEANAPLALVVSDEFARVDDEDL